MHFDKIVSVTQMPLAILRRRGGPGLIALRQCRRRAFYRTGRRDPVL